MSYVAQSRSHGAEWETQNGRGSRIQGRGSEPFMGGYHQAGRVELHEHKCRLMVGVSMGHGGNGRKHFIVLWFCFYKI